MKAIRTIRDAIDGAADQGARFAFHLRDGVVELDGAQLQDRALRGAAALHEIGIRPGDRVGIMGPNHPRWAEWACAVWAMGAVLVPLPHHVRVRAPGHIGEGLARMVRAAGVRAVLADADGAGLLPHGVAIPWDLELAPRPGDPIRPEPGTTAAIQFTSGSSGEPKGVVLSHGAVVGALRACYEAGGMPAADVVQVSWLPFFHDWGLFGNLVWTLLLGSELHVLSLERFMRDPAEWLRLVSRTRATVTPAPTSAWHAALRHAVRRPEGIDLSSLRHCTLGSEAIDPRVVDEMVSVGGRFGLAADASKGAYGLAETVVAVTVVPVQSRMRIEPVDRERLAAEQRADLTTAATARRIASCGPPVSGAELRVAAPGGGALPERSVGEIHIRAPFTMDGYLDEPGLSEGGWLASGDLGYLSGGELFVTGRIKDVVIVMGRNYAAHDIEWAAEQAPGVRIGRCVAFSPEGRDGELVVVAEPGGAGVEDVPRTVWEAVTNNLGIAPREVLVVQKGTIPLTTSGKLQRGWVRHAYATGSLREQTIAAGPRPR